MQTTVARIVKTWTNSQSRFPVAYAMLTCGHSGKIVFKPRRLACAKCGVERERAENESSPKCLACGCGAAIGVFFPDEHRDEDRITQIGDLVDCESCNHYATALARLRDLTPGSIQHSRFRPYDSRGGKEGAYYVYGRNPASPSGVTLLMSIDATPEADKVLRSLSASPLSPTEGLRG